MASGHLEILLAQAQKLYHRNRELQQPMQPPAHPSPLANPFQHNELVKLPSVAQFLQQTLSFSQTVEKKAFTSGIEADRFRLENDPTSLSKMLQAYCRIMQTLLTATEIDGVSKEQLNRFRKQFGHLAYMCRFNNCRSAFSSSNAREDHEATQHTGGIRCTEASCAFSRMGFQSSKALRAHIRTYHKPEETPKGIRVIRKNHKCNGCSQRFCLKTELQRHQASQAGTACGQNGAPSDDDSPSWLQSSAQIELRQFGTGRHDASDGGQPYEFENGSPLPIANASQSSRTMHLISTNIDQNLLSQGPFYGWRAEVAVKERTINVHSIITGLRLSQPQLDLRKAAMAAMIHETRIFRNAKDKGDYLRVCLQNVDQTRVRIQEPDEPQLQQRTTAQSEPAISHISGADLNDDLGVPKGTDAIGHVSHGFRGPFSKNGELIYWKDFEAKSRAHRATFSQPPNESGIAPAAYGGSSAYLSPVHMEAVEDFMRIELLSNEQSLLWGVFDSHFTSFIQQGEPSLTDAPAYNPTPNGLHHPDGQPITHYGSNEPNLEEPSSWLSPGAEPLNDSRRSRMETIPPFGWE
ncbi:hypothetical protein BJY00DRAFT_36019 [Aspergillus carlsbadensis]|nr:hypothetical protein BJY00DRAFT_36019 [Aspergillus carlsbadensis]